MTDEATVESLVKWPTTEEEVTVDLMLRVIGLEMQRNWLKKWQEIDADKDFMKSQLYMEMTQSIISGVGLMACMRALREVNPDSALEFARQYWAMCDGGDSFGELIWQFTEEAGLNPELIKLPQSA